MKHIGSLFAGLLMASSAIAQTACSSSNPLFRFNNKAAQPKEVHALGSNPEFPFLRDWSTPAQVAAAMKRSTNSNRAMEHLNALLVEVGFDNGARDVTEANITPFYIPPGSVGNMGNGDFATMYVKLDGPSPYKAWKITSPTGCYVYFCSKCGNAFFPENSSGNKTACLNVPVTLTGESKEIIVDKPENITTTKKVYVYYHKRRHKQYDMWYPESGIPDDNPSRPLLLSRNKKVDALPQAYKVTVSTTDEKIKVCPDKTAEVATDINVEKLLPGSGTKTRRVQTEYVEVSKKVYRKSARKIHKAERKEERVEDITGFAVNR